MSDAPSREPSLSRPTMGTRRRGRRVAQGLFYAIVVTFTVVLSVEIIWQVWSPALGAGAPTCRGGLASLGRSLQDARIAAEGFEGSPEEAIAMFRRTLAPAWSARDGVATACQGDADGALAFDALERLRYAEENALRRNARDLEPLRRRVRALRLDTSPAP